MNFIINTITDWNEPPRARHQVTYALAKKHKVVFISSNKLGLFGFKKEEVNENLQVIVPYYPVPVKLRVRISILNKLYQEWLYNRLKAIYSGFNVINFDFTAKQLYKYFENTIYYCNDDHIGISKKYNSQFVYYYQRSAEKTVISNSAFCIGTSEFLVKQLKQHNSNSYLIKLGAPTIENFKSNKNLKKDSAQIKVGCVGFANTIDIEIIKFLAKKDDMHITLIGPFDKNIRKEFSQYTNLKFTGPLFHDDLFREIDNFHIGIIPYSLKSTIDRTPNKLWQYLALGKPVVISYTKGIKNWVFPDFYVYQAKSYDGFYSKILKAFSEDKPELNSNRSEFARKNSWDERMKELLKLYKEHIV